jgi:hypothetical protein
MLKSRQPFSVHAPAYKVGGRGVNAIQQRHQSVFEAQRERHQALLRLLQDRKNERMEVLFRHLGGAATERKWA